MRRNFLPSSLCSRCANKTQRPRFYTTSASTTPFNVPVPYRAFIRLKGPGSIQFLQGLITKNIVAEYEAIKYNSGKRVYPQHIYTAFLNAQGRVLNDAFLWVSPVDPENWTIEVDEKEAKTLFAHLKKHKLRSKIELKLLEDTEKPTVMSQILLDQQSEQAARLPEFSGSKPNAQYWIEQLPKAIEESRLSTDNRPHMHSRVLLDHDEAIDTSVQRDLGLTYLIHRLAHGIPEGQIDIPRESALPQQSNMDMLDAIDFRKGCYLGQELTIRTHHTGVVRKRLLPIQLYPFEESPPSSSHGPIFMMDSCHHYPFDLRDRQISNVDTTRGRGIGKVLTSFGNVGLALCRIERMTDIRLTEECTSYDPHQEFVLPCEECEAHPTGKIKVKAFVPQWLRKGIKASLKSHEREKEPDLEKNIEADVPGTDEELTSHMGLLASKALI